jgi:phosphate transport system protein
MGHYEERLERDLGILRGELAKVGSRLDTAVADATRALLTKDHPLAAETVLGDQHVNRATRRIDHLCHVFVARHLPTAGILRFVSSVLRLDIALERIGDYAVAIAREAVQLKAPPSSRVAANLEMMSEQARTMLGQSLKAFLERNAEFARATMEMETQADRLYRRVYEDLLDEGEKGAAPVGDLFALLVCFNRLERITDQAKNICEEAVFAATGQAKQPKVYRILFLDERNAGPSVMAQAIAKKAFPESGRYDGAGWDPLPGLDPDFVAFMARHGHDISGVRPKKLDPGYEALRDYHVIVALECGAEERIPELPYATVLLDWSEEIQAVGRKGELEDNHREQIYKLLAPKIRDLMETLRGEQAT